MHITSLLLNQDRTHTSLYNYFAHFHSSSVIHSYAVNHGFFFHYKALCVTDIQPKKSLPMLRDRSGHLATFILSDNWCATGRHPGGFACRFRWYPGWLSWFLCLTTTQQCRVSIQLDVALSSSQHRLVAPTVLLY